MYEARQNKEKVSRRIDGGGRRIRKIEKSMPLNIAPIQMNAYIMSRPLETYRHVFENNLGRNRTMRNIGAYTDTLINGGVGIVEKILNPLHRISYIPRHWYIKFDSTKVFGNPINANTDNVGVDSNGYIINESDNNEASQIETISVREREDDYLISSICSVNKGTYNPLTNNCRHWVKNVIADFNKTIDWHAPNSSYFVL